MKTLQKFPPGFKFVPTELELLHYLRSKVNGEKTGYEDEVPLKYVELYDIEDPGVLFENTDEDVVYVFTKLRKVAENGSRYERQIFGTSCTWKGSDKAKDVKEEGNCVGSIKNFSFEKNQVKVGYNMKELTLDGRLVHNAEFKDYVVCTIKRKSKVLKRKSKNKKKDLQEGTNYLELPVPVPDEYDSKYILPSSTISNNALSNNIASTSRSLPPHAALQQYQQMQEQEEMAYLELPVPDAYDSEYILPSSKISSNDFSNFASTSRSLPPHAELQQYQQMDKTDSPPVPLVFSSPGYHQNPNPCQEINNQMIADVSLSDQMHGYHYQSNKEVTLIPLMPRSGGNSLGTRIEDPMTDHQWGSRSFGGYNVSMINNQWGLEILREFVAPNL